MSKLDVSMHDDHNVYILGAGFSVDRGLPVVANFMQQIPRAHEWLMKKSRRREAEAIERVMQFRREAAAAAYRIRLNLENVEELFSLASATRDDLSDDMKIVIAATLDFCSEIKKSPTVAFRGSGTTLSRLLRWNSRDQSGGDGESNFEVPSYDFYLAALLGKLNETNTNAQNTFISFNYDLLVEEALDSLGQSFSYGMSNKSYSHGSSNPFKLSANSDVELLKLHGSVNWVTEEEQSKQLIVFRSYSDVLSKNAVPAITPPTWRKVFEGHIGEVWSRAILKISTATRLVVIGFSLAEADKHFKYLLASGLQQNISLREIVFVNDKVDEIKPRVRALFTEDTLDETRTSYSGNRLAEFVTQGTFESKVWKIGRGMHGSIQHIQHLQRAVEAK